MKRNLTGAENLGGEVGGALGLISMPVPQIFKDASVVLSPLELGVHLHMRVAGANTVTVPLDVAFNSSEYEILPGVGVIVTQFGAGQTTIVPADGVTLLRPASGGLLVSEQYGSVILERVLQNTWLVTGGVA